VQVLNEQFESEPGSWSIQQRGALRSYNRLPTFVVDPCRIPRTRWFTQSCCHPVIHAPPFFALATTMPSLVPAAPTSPEAAPSRHKWGFRLTTEMRDKLAAARKELGTTSVKRLMDVSGASRSSVRTWLRNDGEEVKLGRPTFFSAEEEDVIAIYMAAWTKGGDLLTLDLAAALLRQYIAGVGRQEEAERLFGGEGMPGRTFFRLFLGRHAQLRRVQSVPLEGLRAEAATPEAVAKFFAAFRLVCREFYITRAEQVCNTEESMIKAEEPMEGAVAAVVTDNPASRAEFVNPSVQNGSEAASLVSIVCADGTRLPLFVVVAGSGGRLPYAEIENEDGSKSRKPLAGYLDGGVEVHRREKPGLDVQLWEVYAGFAARNMDKRCPGDWKVLLMDGCKVHASPVGLRVLKASKVVVLMFPSHLSHVLQALDKDSFLKTKGDGRKTMRALLPTIPRYSKFHLVHLVQVIHRAAFTGLSSVNIINGFRKTGTWPVEPSVIDVGRLTKGKGAQYAARKVDLEQLALRLGPEARRDMQEPVISFGSISTRGRAIEATSDGMLTAMGQLAAIALEKQKTKDRSQAAKEAKTANAIAQVARDEMAAEQRRSSPAVVARKESLCRRAAQARATAGPVAPYVRARGADVEVEPRRLRPRL